LVQKEEREEEEEEMTIIIHAATHLRGILLIESSQPRDMLPFDVEVVAVAVYVVRCDEQERQHQHETELHVGPEAAPRLCDAAALLLGDSEETGGWVDGDCHCAAYYRLVLIAHQRS